MKDNDLKPFDIKTFAITHRVILLPVLLLFVVLLLPSPFPIPECVGCVGPDADVQRLLGDFQKKSEVVYDNFGSYKNVCTEPYENGGALDVIELIEEDSKSIACRNSNTAWALEAEFKRADGSYYCVDNTGVAMITSGGSISDSRCGYE